MRRFVLAAIAAGFFSGSFCGVTNAQHVHDKHPEAWHRHPGDSPFRNPWKRVFFDDQITICFNEKSRTSSWERLFERTHFNHDCELSTINVDIEKEVVHEVCVTGEFTVGGKLEWAAKALFQRAAFEAHAEVSFGKTGCDTVKQKFRVSATKQVLPCKKVRYTYDRKNVKVEYEFLGADHKIICQHYDHPPLRQETRYCNLDLLVAKGSGWDVIQDGWTDLGRIEGCDCGDGDGDKTNDK